MGKHYCFLLLFAVLFSCNKGPACDEAVDLSEVDIDLDFKDLTHEIYQLESQEELENFLAEYPVVRDHFFGFNDLIPREEYLNEVLKFTQVPKVKAIFKASSYADFQEQLERNRDIREYLTFEYLNTNRDKNLEDVFNLLKSSGIEDLTSTAAIDVYLQSNPQEATYWSFVFNYQSRADLMDENWEILQNPHVDTLYQETLQLINGQEVAYELDQSFARLKSFYPEFEAPEVQTVYSAFGKDVYISDPLVVIGLDYYLGEEASYRPNVYDYVLKRLTPDHLVPQLMQFLSLKYNETESDSRSVLEEMIYYGKALYFAETMVPCAPDSLIIGYTQQELADATVSEAVIWNHFLEEKLLYSEQPVHITRYIDERPNVLEIDKNCPGRIGQWLGWQIVRAYVEETGVDFVELMAETDAQQILTQSKYRPRSR